LLTGEIGCRRGSLSLTRRGKAAFDASGFPHLRTATDEVILSKTSNSSAFCIGDVRDLHSVATVCATRMWFSTRGVKAGALVRYFPLKQCDKIVGAAKYYPRRSAENICRLKQLVGISDSTKHAPVNVMGMTKAVTGSGCFVRAKS